MGVVPLPPLSSGLHPPAPRRRCAPANSCCSHESSCTGSPDSSDPPAPPSHATRPAISAPTPGAGRASQLADSGALGTRVFASTPSLLLFCVGRHPSRTLCEDAPQCAQHGAKSQPCRVRADTIGGHFPHATQLPVPVLRCLVSYRFVQL